MSRARVGAVTSQGDFAQRSSVVRTNYPTLLGTGVTVGVLSDSFNCYAVYAAPGSGVPVSGNQGYAYNGFTADYATDVSTRRSAFGGRRARGGGVPRAMARPRSCRSRMKGRAMLQIVHDVAPGAALAFYTAEGAGSEADLPAASANWPPPARKSSLTTWGTSTSRSSRMASSRRRSMPSKRKGSRISRPPATMETSPTRTPHRASRRPRPAARTPASICSISTARARPSPRRFRSPFRRSPRATCSPWWWSGISPM